MKQAAFAIATKKVNWVEVRGFEKGQGEKLCCIFGLNRGGMWVVSLGWFWAVGYELWEAWSEHSWWISYHLEWQSDQTSKCRSGNQRWLDISTCCISSPKIQWRASSWHVIYNNPMLASFFWDCYRHLPQTSETTSFQTFPTTSLTVMLYQKKQEWYFYYKHTWKLIHAVLCASVR